MTNLLTLSEIHTYYGESHILQGLSLEVKEGTVVALLGRNGMGKTTTIRSIIGLTPPRKGKVIFQGEEITGLPSHQIASRGIGLVPQGRHIFPSLSVAENLTVAARSRGEHTEWDLQKVYGLFPILKDRAKLLGTQLSGGEQQMLAIGRALLTNPILFLLDEPSEGLAPSIIRKITEIIQFLKSNGISMLLIEQNLSLALEVADYFYIVSKGATIYQGNISEIQNNDLLKSKYLGIIVEE